MRDTEQNYCILHLEGSIVLQFFIKLEPCQLNWLDMKGQWDGIVEDSGDKVAQRHHFLTLWTITPLMTLKNDTPFWHFSPPKWMFPPPIT